MSEDRSLRVSWCAFVVALAGLAVFLPALGNGFAYDDTAIIGQDARVHSLAHVKTIFRTGYWADAANALYRPFTTLSFAIDWSLAPGSGAWFHFTNMLAHGVASALVVLLLARFFPPTAALIGGLVFAVHPVHVEAVANVVGRADILVAVFMLGACLVWSLDYGERWAPVRVAAVGLLFALALLTKESAVVLPALLLLVDVARGSLRTRGVTAYLQQNATAFTMFGLVVMGWIALRAAVLGGWAPSKLDPVLEVTTSPLDRVLTALQAWPVYLKLLLYPRTLLADYGPRVLMPLTGVTITAAAGALLLGASIIGGAMAFARGSGRLALALLWFPVAILPVSSLLIPIGVLVAERTLYLPSFALCVGVAATVEAVRPFATRRLPRIALIASATTIVALFAARTLLRVPEWASTERIMGALIRDRPDSFRGRWHFARLAAANGDTALALQRYDEVLRLWPYRQGLTLEAASLAAESGRTRMALEIATFAAARWPDQIGIQRLLAGAALDLGDTAVARQAVREGLRLDPHDELLRRMNAVLPDPSLNENEF